MCARFQEEEGRWRMRALRKGERDEGVAERFFGDFGVAAGSDDDELFSGGGAVGHGSGVAAGGELGFPQFFAGVGMEDAQERIEGSGDEDESARGCDGTAEI